MTQSDINSIWVQRRWHGNGHGKLQQPVTRTITWARQITYALSYTTVMEHALRKEPLPSKSEAKSQSQHPTRSKSKHPNKV